MSELYRVHQYNAGEYDFYIQVSRLLGEPNLEALSQSPGFPRLTREEDQGLKWHPRFYGSFETLRPLYERFIREIIAPAVGEPFLYQKIPNLRVHLPDNVAVGEWHKDSDYGHPQGERNFWVPLTLAAETSGICFIDKSGRAVGVAANVSMMLEFDAVNITHGNFVNNTKRSRVSIDFRVLPSRFYPSAVNVKDARTINTGQRFIKGEYYADEEVGL